MKKAALLIGNNAYPDATLKNAVNDALRLGEKLQKLNFECIVRTDTANAEMETALKEFSDALKIAEVGLFFFAGHGMQISGKNYLTAINTKFDTEITAKHSSLSLDQVIDTMDAGANRTSIIVLDACRNNPYERKWRSSDALGLAPVYAPRGTLIAYATSPGQFASDGTGGNGAYTEALLQHIGAQDTSVEDLFKRVRNTLSSATRGRQISWEHTSLMGDFYFNYSLPIGEYVPEYSSEALADARFGGAKGAIAEVIEGLKSRDWYQQNPAMLKLKRAPLEQTTKDELFVLGRNIYQAACGTSSEAMEFTKHLSRRLGQMQEQHALHLLNGMLFEIYFDSQGGKRKSSKTEELDAVFSLEAEPKFAPSFTFIREMLAPYTKELFYIPGSLKRIIINASIVNINERATIEALYYEGDNILFSSDGASYFDPQNDHFVRELDQTELQKAISEATAVPGVRLSLNLPGSCAGGKVCMPYYPKIQRFSL